ncbi:MAG TPA: glutamyl-tRNA reductase [Bacteroidales bacterium]|nr:glutamyl-tRNA reductase [Bacteroidales bacterium]
MIGLIGINHKTAPVEIREQFVFDKLGIINLAGHFKALSGFEGLYVLSTCNRTEFYFVFQNRIAALPFPELSAIIAKFKNFKGDFGDYSYTLSQNEAIKHFFQVAAGLDSLILGEYQIVGQMKDAYFIARDNDFLGPTLTRMFHKALETGKKIRTNTGISKGALSVSYAAVKMAEELLGNLSKKNILVIGAGKTGQIAVEHFQKKGNARLTIANRTLEKAIVLAQKTNSRFIDILDIQKIIPEQDLILVSTSSELALITKEMIQKAIQLHQRKSILLIDLSVPRNIESGVDLIPGVNLVDMDRLQKMVESSQEIRKSEIDHASTFIEQGLTEFNEWLSFRELMPAISALSENFRSIHHTEIELFLSKSDNKLQAEEYGNHIAKKYINMVIRQLKNATNNGQNPELIPLVNKIFEAKY